MSFGSMPSFPPEQVAILRSKDAVRRKQLLQGLAQLQEEGVLQLLRSIDDSVNGAMAAVVGPLQMDLVQSRESEWDLGFIVRDNPSFAFSTAPDISSKDNHVGRQ